MLGVLSIHQEYMLTRYVEKWTRVGLSTQPLDRVRASSAVDEVYRCAGLIPPAEKIFMDSPLSAATLAVQYMKTDRFLWLQTRDDIMNEVKLALKDEVRQDVWDLAKSRIVEKIRMTGRSTWDHVVECGREDALEDACARAANPDAPATQKWAGAGYNQYGYSWLAFYDFFLTEAKIGFCAKLGGLIAAAQETGGFWPFENTAIIVARPAAMKYDDARRLHCESGPAIRYADGWGSFAWHGVRVPKAWIMDKAMLAPRTALQWRNVEQRRAACEIVGWHKILQLLNARVIDKDDNPQIGELLEVIIPELGPERFLRVQCGTGRIFALPVPPTMRSALQANAWTYGLAPNDYRPEIRT
ncbi:MAG: DUF6745 domain-containing protein [Alphaproteobacteria bacterium]